jgi:serine/threonine protein kinase
LFGYAEKSNTLFAVDFGLAKKYRELNIHIPLFEKYSLTGTARYASINAHKGLELSRRDDLESIGIMMINFVCGYLPWENVG